jgi:site-specific recombinase XerD
LESSIPSVWIDFLSELTHLQGRSPNTAKHYSTAKNRLVNWGTTELEDLTPATLASFAAYLERDGMKLSTISFYLNALASFTHWCHMRGRIQSDPFYGFKRKTPELPPIKAIRWTEAQAIIENVASRAFWQRDRALLNFLLNTGARISEALNCTLDMLDTSDWKVTFTKTKGRRARTIYFGPKYQIQLKDYLKWREELWKSEWVFPARDGTQMSIEGAQEIPHQYELGVTLHQFRHTYITQLAMKTKDMRVTQRLAGHASIQTTSRYFEAWEEEIREAATAIEDERQIVGKNGKRRFAIA